MEGGGGGEGFGGFGERKETGFCLDETFLEEPESWEPLRLS